MTRPDSLVLTLAPELLATLEPRDLAGRLATVLRRELARSWVEVVLHLGGEPVKVRSGEPRGATNVLVDTLCADGVVVAHVAVPASAEERPALGAALAACAPLAARALRNAFEHQRMTSLAMTDALTGLGTRRLFQDALEREQRARQRDRRAHAVLLVDVDRFKPINDRYGHAAGDAALVRLARALVGAVRRGDLVCRMGGDELCVLLVEPEGHALDAHGIAERIRASAQAIALPGGERLSVSVGVAENRPEEWLDGAALLEAADRALYAAKRRGGNAALEAAPGRHSHDPGRMVA